MFWVQIINCKNSDSYKSITHYFNKALCNRVGLSYYFIFNRIKKNVHLHILLSLDNNYNLLNYMGIGSLNPSILK